VVCRAPEEFARETRFEPRDYAVIVTHDHGLDQRVVEALLPRPLAFLGMIGSVPKQRKFAMRLAARGFAEADIARLRSPLGVAIGAATPEEIAVSVMAEIIAARRGVPLGPAWTPPARHGEETALAARRGPAGPEGAAGAPVPGGAVGSS
jgi:xanthine dehydrogenase accessory factor